MNDLQLFEPLKSIIDVTSDKKNTILYFLSLDLKKKLTEYNLCEDNDFYLNDFIICIKKNNLKNDFTGKITEICKNKLCLKVNNYNVKINPNHYYIFIKPNTSKKNDRHFFESLLKVL